MRSVGGETGEHLAIDTTVSIAAIITVGNGGEHIIGSAAKTADTGPADQESTVHQCREKRWQWLLALPHGRSAFGIVQHIMSEAARLPIACSNG